MTLTLLLLLGCLGEPPSMKDGKKDDGKPGVGVYDPGERIQEYRERILALFEKDQDSRYEGQQAFQNVPPGTPIGPVERAALDKMARASKAHVAELRKLMAKHGFPGFKRVGRDAASAAVLIVTNADKDLAFQKKFLEEMKKAADANDADRGDCAMLVDRVLVAEGKRQRYGTMISVKGDKVTPMPVEDPKNLDRRRAEVGLPPMEEYLETVKSRYGKGGRGGGP
jgi:hypothetical protein